MDIHGNYIGGSWVESGEVTQDINPSDTSQVVGCYSRAGKKEVEQAIQAANAALIAWSHTTPWERAQMLDKIGDELMSRRQELGELLSREEGKTIPEGVGEVTRSGNIFKFFAGEAMRIPGEKMLSTTPGVEVEITREPVGVVGVITPWNFPCVIPSWKVASALAFGNCVVFKPASLVPATAWALTEIISRSGIPAGVFNTVLAPSSVIDEVLLPSPLVNAITFTGSVETGNKIAARAVATTMKKYQAEMGGKNPLVVLDDADLTIAVNCAIDGAFFSTGERCTGTERIIVTEGIHDRFVKAMCERMKTLVVDHAQKPTTKIGPVIDPTQLKQDTDYLEIGKKEGAKLFGGNRLKRETEGDYLEPALFTETTNDMRINQEEIFGPVSAVIRVKDYEEALATANDTKYGLSSAIQTTSMKYANHFQRYSQAGMVLVNMPTAAGDFHLPFGGRKLQLRIA